MEGQSLDDVKARVLLRCLCPNIHTSVSGLSSRSYHSLIDTATKRGPAPKRLLASQFTPSISQLPTSSISWPPTTSIRRQPTSPLPIAPPCHNAVGVVPRINHSSDRLLLNYAGSTIGGGIMRGHAMSPARGGRAPVLRYLLSRLRPRLLRKTTRSVASRGRFRNHCSPGPHPR